MDIDNAQGEARFLVFALNRSKTPLRFPVVSELSDVAAGEGGAHARQLTCDARPALRLGAESGLGGDRASGLPVLQTLLQMGEPLPLQKC